MEPFLGQIISFAGNFAPRGWAFCNGQLLPINQYQALFSLLGTNYGGDGRTTFALPEMRGRAAMHAGTGPGLPGEPLGRRGGLESIQLTTLNMPSHNHAVSESLALACRSEAGGEDDPTGAFLATGEQTYSATTAASTGDMHANAITGTVEIGMTGGNQPVDIRQPYQAINFIIAIQGTFPSRS